MKYLILLASVIFLAQSCSVAPSMRESARSYDWATYTNFSWQSKIDSAISSYPLLLYPSYERRFGGPLPRQLPNGTHAYLSAMNL